VQFASAGNYNFNDCIELPFDQGDASTNFRKLFAQGVDWAAYGGGGWPRTALEPNAELVVPLEVHPASNALSGPVAGAPVRMSLRPFRPNPFLQETVVSFGIAESGIVDLAVYDITGRRVATLAGGWRPTGWHTAAWRGMDEGGNRVASGVYFVQLRAGGRSERGTVSLVR
jgi:hypothetical protein